MKKKKAEKKRTGRKRVSKKILALILVCLTVCVTLFPRMNVEAASYPVITIDSSMYDKHFKKGTKAELKFEIEHWGCGRFLGPTPPTLVFSYTR